MDLASLRARLDARPRAHLASLPTPLRPARRLQAALGPECPELLLKLDEETGFGLGGNKVRKLEYELAPSRLSGVTHLVTTGGVQSNHCRVTAAAAAHLGLGCVLVLDGAPPDPPTGNALLMSRFGARVRTVSTRAERAAGMERAAADIAEAGGRALIVPLGASTPRGALGYVRALVELHDQLPPVADRAVHLFVASSSGGTLAGLRAGLALLERDDVTLTAVSSDTPAEALATTSRTLARGALELLEVAPARLEAEGGRVEIDDGQIGGGYGVPTAAADEAAELLARSEGVLADPVYTAKAAAGLVAAVRSGRFPTGDRVLFWHTGGHPALFA